MHSALPLYLHRLTFKHLPNISIFYKYFCAVFTFVLVFTGIELVLFKVGCRVLRFGFVTKTVDNTRMFVKLYFTY